jgi:hypothetical protein
MFFIEFSPPLVSLEAVINILVGQAAINYVVKSIPEARYLGKDHPRELEDQESDHFRDARNDRHPWRQGTHVHHHC